MLIAGLLGGASGGRTDSKGDTIAGAEAVVAPLSQSDAAADGRAE